jgi:NitT/TauT family transport system permease protein
VASALLALTPWLAFVAVWAALTETGLVDSLFLAAPGKTLAALRRGLFETHELGWALLFTLRRALSGFLVASLLGVPLGLLVGGVPTIDRLFGRAIDGLRSMPATALFPAFLLAFGIGEASKVAVATFVCLWALVIYTASGVRSSGDTRRYLLKLHGVSASQLFFDGLFYPALPSILGGMRTSLSLALVVTISVEMLVGTRVGLGQTIYIAQSTYAIPDMYAAITLAALSGVLFNWLFQTLARACVRWEKTPR